MTDRELFVFHFGRWAGRIAVGAAVLVVLVFATGCTDYNRVADEGVDIACSDRGATARRAYRAARDAEFRQKDRALCLRCPGEAALQCTGDPIALP